MRQLLRRHRTYFLIVTLAGLALRLFFIFRFPIITYDAFVYGDIAKNILQHGSVALLEDNQIVLSYLRLPGYPGFLAACFAIFGTEHYTAVMLTQAFLDMVTCLLVAGLAYELVSPAAARAAYLLAALCPFTANYTATPLTETNSILMTSLALYAAVRGLDAVSRRQVLRSSLKWWVLCGAAIGAGILLRPDGGLLLISVGIFLLARLFRADLPHRKPLFVAGVVTLLVALAPLVPWTIRNWRLFREFQPLSPIYGQGPGETGAVGLNRWFATWVADYSSVEDFEFKMPNETIDPALISTRAFDSPEQRARTLQLLEDYNQNVEVTPALDARFAELAAERIHHAPLRYYVWLPALRAVSLWFRPRIELLPIQQHWWDYEDDPHDFSWAAFLALLNLLLVTTAKYGAIIWRRASSRQLGLKPPRYFSMLIVFVVVRTAFMAAQPNPEPRYLLECYPIVLLLAGVALARRFTPGKGGLPSGTASGNVPTAT